MLCKPHASARLELLKCMGFLQSLPGQTCCLLDIMHKSSPELDLIMLNGAGDRQPSTRNGPVLSSVDCCAC